MCAKGASIWVALVAVAIGCAPTALRDDRASVPTAADGARPGPSAQSAGAVAIVETASGRTTFRIEIADTDELRARGLMGRRSLAADAGMAFVWTEDHASAFYMRGTLIPLAVAFFDAEGKILRILEMTPCAADPCPLYDPGVRYRSALEVSAGALTRAGAREGDRISIVR